MSKHTINFRYEHPSGYWSGLFEVAFDCTPFYRGRYSGPPELCHEDEGGEIELGEVKLIGFSLYGYDGVTVQVLDDLTETGRKTYLELFHAALEDGDGKVLASLEMACFEYAQDAVASYMDGHDDRDD